MSNKVGITAQTVGAVIQTSALGKRHVCLKDDYSYLLAWACRDVKAVQVAGQDECYHIWYLDYFGTIRVYGHFGSCFQGDRGYVIALFYFAETSAPKILLFMMFIV